MPFAIHFTWKREPAAVDRITREIEDLLLPMGGRPHRGKLLHPAAEALAGAYPRMAAFLKLAESYDPGRRFQNGISKRMCFRRRKAAGRGR
jgi:xylitol oxidase